MCKSSLLGGVSVLALAAVGVMASSSQAALLTYDGFDYTAGATLEGQTGGSGWSGGWIAPNANKWNIGAATLNYPGLPTSGNAGERTGTNDRPAATRALATPITGGTFYVSGLFATNAAFSDSSYGVTLFLSDGNFNARGSFGIRFSNGASEWFPIIAGAAALNTNPPELVRGTTGLGTSTVNLLVAKVDMVASTISVFVNPTVGAAEPAATLTAAFASNGSVAYAGFYAPFTRSSQGFDELRIGETYADVTAIPEPVSLSVLGLVGVGLMSRRRSR